MPDRNVRMIAKGVIEQVTRPDGRSGWDQRQVVPAINAAEPTAISFSPDWRTLVAIGNERTLIYKLDITGTLFVLKYDITP